MRAYSGKTRPPVSLPAAQSVARLPRRAASTLPAGDLRPQAVAQQQLQDMADHAAPARRISQLQAMVDARVAQAGAVTRELTGPALNPAASRLAPRAGARPPASAATVVQRKIGDEGNVVFGLEGKGPDAIRSAIAAGYTTFDGADSYGNTIILLAAALRDAALHEGRRREDFEVIYKVDKTEPDDLMMHLEAIAERFDGYLDQVLIHKVTDRQRAAAYGPVLSLLKRDGVIKSVGAGDVAAGMAEHLATMDSFEVDATALFQGPDHEALARNLDLTRKPVFVYNVIGTLKSLLHIPDEKSPSDVQIMAMVSKLKGLVGAAEPILSSSSAARQVSNRAVFDPQEDQTAAIGEAYRAIDRAGAANESAVSIAEMPPTVATRVEAILFEGPDWAAEKLFDDPAQYAIHRDRCALRFTPQELGTLYRGVDEDRAKTFTLQQLIGMLFDGSGNCHRVEASNFFMRGFGHQ